MVIYEIRMFDWRASSVISTYLGGAQSTPDAIQKCVERAVKAGRITLLEGVALTNKALGYSDAGTIDTNRWQFTTEKAEARAL